MSSVIHVQLALFLCVKTKTGDLKSNTKTQQYLHRLFKAGKTNSLSADQKKELPDYGYLRKSHNYN